MLPVEAAGLLSDAGGHKGRAVVLTIPWRWPRETPQPFMDGPRNPQRLRPVPI